MLLNLSTDPYLPVIWSLPANTDCAGALGYIQRHRHGQVTEAGYSLCIAGQHNR